MPRRRAVRANRRGGERGRPRVARRHRRRAGEPVLDSDDEAVVAGTLRVAVEVGRADRRVGGGRRPDACRRRCALAPAPRRPRGRLSAADRRAEAGRAGVARASRALSATSGICGICGTSRCRSSTTWPGGPTARCGASGSIAFAPLAARALRAARPRARDAGRSLRPMAEVGPVRSKKPATCCTIAWSCSTGSRRRRRYGRVFVGTPHQARGRPFRVVFVPGLAERVVPQRPREDPLLLDDRRRGSTRSRQAGRAQQRRAAAAEAGDRRGDRAAVSVVSAARRRRDAGARAVVLRARRGARHHRRVPDHRALASEAAEEAGASLAWPAPKNPRSRDRRSRARSRVAQAAARRRAIRRSVARARALPARAQRVAAALRHQPLGAGPEGLVAERRAVQRGARHSRRRSARHRLASRPYSLSALQRFASCPYQFLLATIYRLEPWDEPEPLVRHGSADARQPVSPARRPSSTAPCRKPDALPVTPDRVARGLAAARRRRSSASRGVRRNCWRRRSTRVWRDEIDELRRDLGIWVQKLADDRSWVPAYFEFSFGLSDEGRDERSLKQPVTIDGRFVLRGSVDLIERSQNGDIAARHRSQDRQEPRRSTDLIVGGGGRSSRCCTALAVEQGLGTKVVEGRLYYCTTAGGFADHPIQSTTTTATRACRC